MIPPDDPLLPSPAFSQLSARACRPPTSYNALAASEAPPRTPVDLLVVSANGQDHNRPQSPYVIDSGSKDADLPATLVTPATPHQMSLVVTHLTALSPFPTSSSPSQAIPAAAAAAVVTTTTTTAGPVVPPRYSTNSTADFVEVTTPCDEPPADDLSSLPQPQHHFQCHDKQVRRGRASGANLLLPSPTEPQPSSLSKPKDDSQLSTLGDDTLVVDHQTPAMQPSKAIGGETDPSPSPGKLPAKEIALDQSQNDLAIQVETLTAQLNRLQRQCDQMAGLMQLKDWVTSLWMKRTRKWEARATELERDCNHLREELKRSQERKVFWRRTATERLIVSQQWADMCQRQTEEIVDLKHRVVAHQGRIEMLELVLDEAGSVASAASTELARSVDGLDDLEDVDEQVNMQPQSPSAVHPSFPTRTSYMSTMSAISSTSGSSAAESYTDDLDVDDVGLPSPPSEPTSSYSPARPAFTENAEPEPTPTHSKEEIESLLAELHEGQVVFEDHLAKYAADREALDQGWDELVAARDRFEEEYEDFDESVRASNEAATRRAAMFERRANMLLDQEMELDLLKRRYMDKIRNYELITIDLKHREDRYFIGLDHVHILAEDMEGSRIQNEATERVLREEWNDVEDAWMAVWRRHKRLIRAAQLCKCTCVCGNRGGVETWNDDEVPALLLGEEGREIERTKQVRAIVDEEMKKRRDDGGRRLRCVRDCGCPECAPGEVEVSAVRVRFRKESGLGLMVRGIIFLKELPSPTFNHGLPDQDGLHGLALELPVASCPPHDGAWLDSSVRRSRWLLIRWRWAVVPPIEGEVEVIGEERVFKRQREEAVEHHEELYIEASSREWEEERSSSSLELRSASPKSPLVIPDSPSARAYLTLFNLVPLPIPCYPHQELSYTYSRMICSSLSIGALPGAGSSLFSPTSPTAGNHHKI